MISRKPLQMGAALGFAASLVCASAFAGQQAGGGYETERERIQKQQELRQQEMQQEQMRQPGMEGRLERDRGRELRAGEIGDIGRIDVDRDRLVSEDEYKEWRGSVFGKLDADKDGELTQLEYIVMAPVVTRLDTTPTRLANRFEELDQENKGKLTEDEYVNAKIEQFKEADTDGDGKLSVEELQAVIEQRD
jgi:hypothetical protein